MKPLFIVISAPSGAGKTTLCDLLLQSYPELCYSVSCTTRSPRINEEDGIDYHFLDETRFKQLIEADEFLEYACVHDYFYGTLKGPIVQALAENQSVILDIDVAGADQVRSYVRQLPVNDPLRLGFVDIFILPPSMEVLETRLWQRGTDAPDVIAKRLHNAQKEMQAADKYMYRVTNSDLETALRRLCDIINVKSEII